MQVYSLRPGKPAALRARFDAGTIHRRCCLRECCSQAVNYGRHIFIAHIPEVGDVEIEGRHLGERRMSRELIVCSGRGVFRRDGCPLHNIEGSFQGNV